MSLSSRRWFPYVAALTLLMMMELLWLPWVHPPGRHVRTASSDAPSQTNFSGVDGGDGSTGRLLSTAPGEPAAGAAPVRHQRPLLVLHWTERPADSGGGGVMLSLDDRSFSACAASSCRGTGDRSLLLHADAVLFHGRLLRLRDLPQRRLPRQLFVFVTRESPQSTHLSLKRLDNFFNLTMTYSRNASVVFPYGQTTSGKQHGTLPFFHRRQGRVAWLVSHCSTVSKREEYVSQLRAHIAVDTFGACGERRCPGTRSHCYRQMAETHLFYLAFENSLCDDYITEKFWLALEAGMVPVVRGPPPGAYRRVAPPNSFIHVDEFAGPKALADYLLSVSQNRTLYNRYQTWRRSHRVLKPEGLCDLCRHLMTATGRSDMVRLSVTWDVDMHCRQPTDLKRIG